MAEKMHAVMLWCLTKFLLLTRFSLPKLKLEHRCTFCTLLTASFRSSKNTAKVYFDYWGYVLDTIRQLALLKHCLLVTLSIRSLSTFWFKIVWILWLEDWLPFCSESKAQIQAINNVFNKLFNLSVQLMSQM